MAYNIGLNVVEVDGAGAPAIVGAAVSVAGFNITTQRGLANRPTRVTSLKQFTDQFGGYIRDGYGAYLVKGFFDNGGQTAYVNRVVSTAADPAAASQAASLALSDLDNRATLRVQAGQKGATDPGRWGNDVYVKVALSSSAESRLRETAPATVTGSALANTVDMSAQPKLSVRVDGEQAPTEVAFAAADFAQLAAATPREIVEAINRRTAKFIASLTQDQRLRLTSTGQVASLAKRPTRLDVTAAVAQLGLAAGAADATVAALTANGTQLAKADDFQPGEAIAVVEGAQTANTKVLRVNPDTGSIEWAPAIANPAGFNGLATVVRKLEFDLTVAFGGKEDKHLVEQFRGLSMESEAPNYARKVINNDATGSRYITVVDSGSASATGNNRPKALEFTRLDNGRDGVPTVLDYVGAADRKTGFYAFDPADIQLLTCERTDAAVVAAALAYCQGRADCMYVGAVPMAAVGAGQAVAYGQAFQGKKVYGALYGPWIKVVDPAGNGSNPVKFIPPCGHVMGAYARVENTRGIWKAPAGDEANLAGALDVEYQLSDADHTDLVKNGSVNGIRAVPGAGIVVDASRTLSTDTRWLYVNVRLLFNYVKSSLKKGLRWVRQEPNRDTLWSAVRLSAVTPFLMGLWRQGAFGTGKPEEVFKVICDASNNPPEQVDQGIFKVEVYFYPSKPAETIVIIVGQQPSGATASEA